MRHHRLRTAAAFAAAALASAAATAFGADDRTEDHYVGPWHVGMRTDEATDEVDHVASVDDGDYRLAIRCFANKSSIVLFSRAQIPPFQAGLKLDVIVRTDKAIPKMGSAHADRPDLIAIDGDLIRFADLADARVLRVRMASDAGDRIDATFDVSQARHALAGPLEKCLH